MTMIRKEFDAYTIQHYGFGNFTNEVVITCYKASTAAAPFTIAGLGRLVFVKDGTPLPNFVNPSFPDISFPISRYMEIISTLREEKPLFLWFDTVSKFGGLTTVEKELVGEEEGK
jgi:hypothetical protein